MSKLDEAVERLETELRDCVAAGQEVAFAKVGDLTGILSALKVRTEAIEPFAKAAEDIPADVEDFKVVASVPGGHNARPFAKMGERLTAGNFRTARAALQDPEDTP